MVKGVYVGFSTNILLHARCQHNQVYWDGLPYHAFGLGATSLLGGQRFARPRKMGAYKSWVAEFEASGRQIPGRASDHSPAF